MMRVRKKISWILASVLAVSLAGCCSDDEPLGVSESAIGGPTTVLLGTSGTSGILAGTTVTNTGTTTVEGNLGVSPDSAVVGFPPGTVGGTIQTGVIAAPAQTALTTAFLDAQGRTTGAISLPGELAGLTLTPGLYTATTPLTLNGDIILNALGNPDAVFIIQTPSSLTTAAGSQVLLTSGAQAANIIWVVGTSANLGADSDFNGTILADDNITVGSGAHVNGRLLARTGSVTLNSNVIEIP
jgi:hypothetical protein